MTTRLLAAIALATAGSAVQAANITIVPTDPAGEGFNDPTAFTPVGGNNATTLGEARLNVCLLYTSPSPRDRQKSRMPSSA